MNLRRTLLATSPLCLLGLLLALVPARAAAPMASTANAPTPAPLAGPGVVWTTVERFLRAVDAGQVDEALALLAPDMAMDREYQQRPCTLVISGVDGLQRSAVGREAVERLVRVWSETRAAHGKRSLLRTVDAWDDCHSREVLWGCLVVEQSGPEGRPQRLFGSALLEYVGGSPHITHLHLSPQGTEERSVELLHWAPDLCEREAPGGDR